MHDDLIFSWLHLSDVHFRPGDPAKRQHQGLVIDQLLKDLATQHTKGRTPTPDAIFISGDIAYHGGSVSAGGESEYAEALDWIDNIRGIFGLERGQVFTVPGNHDVVRTPKPKKAPDVGWWLSKARSRKGEELLDAALSEDDENLRRRFLSYLDFAGKLNPVCADLFWAARLKARRTAGLSIRLVGLNTALLANDDFDRGKLRLGFTQTKKISSEFGPDRNGRELVIVLSHHPLRGGWLVDEKEVSAWFSANVNIHLFGHLHKQAIELHHIDSAGSYIEIATGAVSGDSAPMAEAETFGYNFGGIGLDQEGGFEVRVWPRRMQRADKTFKVDSRLLSDYEHHSRHPLKAGFHPSDCRIPITLKKSADVCTSAARIHSALERQLLNAGSVHDESNVFILLVRVRAPIDCSKCVEVIKMHRCVEAISDVFGHEDIVVQARSEFPSSPYSGIVPSDISAVVESLGDIVEVQVLDVTREHRVTSVSVEATASTRGIRAFLCLSDTALRTDFLFNKIRSAMQTEDFLSTYSTYLMRAFEVAAKPSQGAASASGPAVVIAECFVTCGGYYELVAMIQQIEQQLRTTERRTLLAMSDWRRDAMER